MKTVKFGFIGTGNMGGALARAAARELSGTDLYLANRTPAKAERLAAEIGGKVSTNAEIAETCAYIFLGVKPQMMGDMLAELAPVLKARTDSFVLVSMAAGLTIADIQRMAGGAYPVLRIMPNTPASIGAGMILYTAGPGVSGEALDLFLEVMAPAGVFDALPEHLMDAGSAVSGSGPAFVYMFLEALADGGVACGLPRDKALLYAAKMAEGAARLVMDSGSHPGALKDAVCSPGGSTIAGVRALEKGAFRSAATEAVLATYARNGELAELGKK